MSPVLGEGTEVAQELAEVHSSVAAGAYRHLVLAAPGIAALAQPGQFVAATVGGATSGLLLRRSFSLHAADPVAGTVEIVVAAHGAGSTWITQRRPGDGLDLVGPQDVIEPSAGDEGTQHVLAGNDLVHDSLIVRLGSGQVGFQVGH